MSPAAKTELAVVMEIAHNLPLGYRADKRHSPHL